MQYNFQKYPFFVPLSGLLLGYVLLRVGWAEDFSLGWWLIVGLICLVQSVLGIGSSLRVLGVFLLHVVLGVVWVGETGGEDLFEINKTWVGRGDSAYALVEVRDSWLPGTKGLRGTVYCLGIKVSGGRFRSWDGDFRVSVRGKAPVPPALGLYWVAVKELREYPLPEVPGEPNWRQIMRSMGIRGYINKTAIWYRVSHGSKAHVSWVYRYRSKVLVTLQEALRRRLQSQHAGLVYAMLLGDKSGLDPAMEAQFGAAGLLHVLAVSGMHVALIMGALFWVFSGFGARGSLGISSLIVLLAAGWGYTFLTGGGAAVVRAMISATWMWLGKYAFKRKQSLLHVLTGCAYIQLLLDPPCIEQMGFQLSYLAVFGIAWLHPKIINRLPPLSRPSLWLAENTSLTLSATLFTLPLLLWQFQSFPTWFLLGNLLLLPLFSLSVYLTLVCLLLGWVPWLGDVLYTVFDHGLAGLLWLLSAMQSLPLPQLLALPMDVLDLFLMGLCIWAMCGFIAVRLTGKISLLSNTAKLPAGVVLSPPQRYPFKAYHWVVFGILSFFMLCAHLEWTRRVRHQNQEHFVVHLHGVTICVDKKGGNLRLTGPWRNERMKKFIWQKLQKYAEQNGVREVEWVNQLPLYYE